MTVTVLVGGILHGFVEGVDAKQLTEFRDRLLKELPPYAVPTSLHPTDRLPRNANDKIDATNLTHQVKSGLLSQ